jgi:4-hydroxybenzoate polyprenyltransferase
VFNDIADADFDGRVERTRARPIPSGQVSRKQAACFMAFLMLLGLAILLQFNPFAMLVGAASLFLIFTYPFMKRITYWPQAWLGLTFNWGALLGWAAVRGELALPSFVLYAAGFFWTLGYDTIYAHMDKEDDVLIGVKSTALRLGNATRDWLVGFYVLTLAGIGLSGWFAGLAWPFFALLALGGVHLAWQHQSLRIDDPKNCLFLFRSNRWFGWIVLAAIVAGNLAR